MVVVAPNCPDDYADVAALKADLRIDEWSKYPVNIGLKFARRLLVGGITRQKYEQAAANRGTRSSSREPQNVTTHEQLGHVRASSK